MNYVYLRGDRARTDQILKWLKARGGWVYSKKGFLERDLAKLLEVSEMEAMRLTRMLASNGKVERRAWNNTLYGLALLKPKYQEALDAKIMSEDQEKPKRTRSD